METTQNNKEKFLSLVASLIVYFPDYQIEKREDDISARFYSKNDPAKGFHLRPDVYKGKFEVSPWIKKTPDYRFYEVYDEKGVRIISPSAGFSIDRPVEQIAKGIKSRFIPEFEIYYAAWMKYWQKQHDYKCGKDAAIKEIAALVNVEPAPSIGSTSFAEELRETIHTYHSNNQNLKEYVSSIRVNSPESIKIELSVNMEKARKIIELIKNL